MATDRLRRLQHVVCGIHAKPGKIIFAGDLRAWREAALDEVLWNSHLVWFVDLCRM